MLHLIPDKYYLVRALRPFSYSVAIITCGLGVALAYNNHECDSIRAIAVIVTGVLLQASANLVNDYADLAYWKEAPGNIYAEVAKQIRFNCIIAIIIAVIACAIGLWLSILVGWPLIILGLIGVCGGYSYVGAPIYYKRFGLGVPAVFIFTGILMVSGSYYAVSGIWSSKVLVISLPVSLLSSALMLSNEIRDFLSDQSSNIKTLTVRIGFIPAKFIYSLLLFIVYPLSFFIFWKGYINNPLYILLSLTCIWQPAKLLYLMPGDVTLDKLPPLTGRFFLLFGVGFILSVL